MALSTHLAELAEKHRLLDRTIEEELARPSADELAVARLKREKLKLKDKMNRLSHETQH
jgi:hypothetical protein